VTSGTASYYLSRGLRRVALALPAAVLVALDRRVSEVRFRSRNSVITEAIRHFLSCPDADWTCGDHPRTGDQT
jgi:metal-responsive CopG/Arc/MetJ family transcriptional regulator